MKFSYCKFSRHIWLVFSESGTGIISAREDKKNDNVKFWSAYKRFHLSVTFVLVQGFREPFFHDNGILEVVKYYWTLSFLDHSLLIALF